MAEAIFLTYRYRVKDGSASTKRALRKQSRAVNYVWNYCCQIDREARRRYYAGHNVKRPSAFDLSALCRGVTKELGIHSDTIDAICKKFADAREQAFPDSPRFRSFKRNLDWIPFSNFDRPAKLEGDALTLLRRRYRLWLSREIPDGGKPKSWNMGTDSRGRWYVNIQVELPKPEQRAGKAIGVDLGLKALATLSTGVVIAAPNLYRKAEARLALLQKRKQKARARSLAAKVANQRRHFLHVASARITREYAEIYVGDVSPSKLSKTRMAKSVQDAGWSMLRNFLSYKSIATGGKMRVVSERWSTQACSCCGSLSSETRPKGIAGLRIRHWDCSDCGASHDRDHNAASNILRAGLEH